MKRSIILFLAGLMCLSSCQYDDSALWDSIKKNEDSIRDAQERIVKLEQLCNQLNTNINGLQTIVQALQENDYVTSITPIRQGDAEIGYAISFSKSGDVTIYHGKDGQTPKVGVKENTDGIWYWTLDGEWLLDDAGKKIRAEGRDGEKGEPGQDGADGKDGITPQLKIVEGWWYISTDNGQEWIKLGKANGEDGADGQDGKPGQDGADGIDGDSFFQNVNVTETEVEFVLSDGQRFTLPRSPKLTIRFDQDITGIYTQPGKTITINYMLEHADANTVISVSSDGYYRVRLQKTDQSSGQLLVECPDPCLEGYVNVHVSDGNGFSILQVIRFTSTVTVSVKGVTFKMIRVAGGTFTMGATPEQGSDAYRNETPAHEVTLSDYWIGETEVTQELWEAVMGSNPSNHKGNPKRPVENVSWNDIVNDFLPKLNQLTGKTFSLPTEAQWEFAARGGTKRIHYKYSGSDDIDAVAWYDDNSGYVTHPVGEKLPNELGLYDMSGNVWEWCLDRYGDYSAGAQTNPTGPASGFDRVLRGGNCSCIAEACRVSFRYDSSPDDRNSNIGLRLVSSH